ncbi:MAG TPA: tyrosine-type recombinase/integrase [Azospirillum sp.]
MAGLRIITAVAYDRHPELTPAELPKCRLPVGFRFLATAEMEIVEPVLLFLSDRYAKTKKGWEKVALSQSAACDDLYEWWSYLELVDLHWRDVTTEDVQGYRTALENAVSPKTRQRYKPNTIRRRLGTILSFHKWALAQKYTDEVVDRKQLKHVPRSDDENVLAHVGTSLGLTEASDLLPDEEETVPNPFNNTRDLQAVLTALGPKPSERGRDARPARNRLAAMFALATGTRISETLSLTLADILGLKRPPDAAPTASVVMWLRKTKRRRPRKILVPVWLLDELLLYVDGERAEAVAKAQALGRRPAPNLFINGIGANKRDVGKALTRRSLSRDFRNAVLSTELYTVIEEDVENGLPQRLLAQHSFHDLRHTFAVQQYLGRKAKGDAEPWKAIAALLGHKSWKTTMDYYLTSVSISEAELSDVMTAYFHSILSLDGSADDLK